MTHTIVIIQSTPHFVYTNFSIFYYKITEITHKSVSQCLKKKSKILSPFFRKTIGSNNSFTLIENNSWFLKI